MLIKLNGPVIAAGESLSAALDCTQGEIVRMYMPTAWTPANITFQLSFDGVAWSDLYDRNGREVTTAIVPNSVVVVSQDMRVVSLLKIRSGTRAAPIVQTAQRAFQVMINK